MGIPGVGKTTYIKERFKKDVIVLDLYTFQCKYGAFQGYYELMKELKEKIKDDNRNGRDIVVEHTILKRKRRKEYVEAIREVTDEEISLVFIDKTDDEIFNQLMERYEKMGLIIDEKLKDTTREEIKANRETLEKPNETKLYKISIE